MRGRYQKGLGGAMVGDGLTLRRHGLRGGGMGVGERRCSGVKEGGPGT